jgi:hypothetical protein
MNEGVPVASEIEVAPPRRSPSRVVGGIGHLEEYLVLAERVSRTAMVPAPLRNKPDEVLAVVLFGAELGVGPMQALQGINFVAGRPSASAELLRALVLDAGHGFIVDGDDTQATAQCKRLDWTEWRSTTFTIDDAHRAGLQGDNWRKYPDAMLSARVTSKACRLFFPDVISGMSYTPEEVESFTMPSSPRPRVVEHEEGETGEAMTDDQRYALTTSLSLLDENDRSSVKANWLGAQLPPLANGLTMAQAERALSIVDAVLNAVSGDAIDAEIVESRSHDESDDETASSNDDIPPATATQVRALNTLLSKRGVVGPARHDVARDIVGRQVGSLNDLSKFEATTLIDYLKSCGESEIMMSPDQVV